MRSIAIISILIVAAADARGQVPASSYEYLDQNWNEAERQRFWWESQGSQLIPFAWLSALEQPGNSQPFRERGHLESFGFVFSGPGRPEETTELPIGFARDRNNGQVGKKGREWLGLTCAACHTSLLAHGGRRVLIEGGPASIDLGAFHGALTDAVAQTLSDIPKWERFARTLLGSEFDAGHEDLRTEVLEEFDRLRIRESVNELPADRRAGFGRADAFGRIFNEVVAVHLRDERNGSVPNAPVSYPHLWGSNQADRVQWNASADNRRTEGSLEIGPLSRNIGQVIGVFGRVELEPVQWPATQDKLWLLSWRRGYRSSIQVESLKWLESRVKVLRSPPWPELLFGEIDPGRAERGARVYSHHCADCHKVVPRDKEHLEFRVNVMDVGTDPLMVENFVGRRSLTRALEGSKKRIRKGDPFQADAPSYEIVLNAVIGVLSENALKLPETTGEVATATDGLASRFEELYAEAHEEPAAPGAATQTNVAGALRHPPARYRARSHNGIWATGPFLHNGSVPTLAELLEHRRAPVFKIVRGSFDPAAVGVRFARVAACAPGDGECIDTRIPGNGNSGHMFGVHLPADEKLDLIEYVKTLGAPEPRR